MSEIINTVNDIFTGEFGLYWALGLIVMGVSDVLIAHLVIKKRMLQKSPEEAKKSRPAFIMLNVYGGLFALIGFYGLDVHFGTL